MKTILVLGSGAAIYREYILAAAARRYRLVLLQADPPTWQRPYVADHALAALDEPEAVIDRARTLAIHHRLDGVLTYEEGTVPAAAAVAAEFGLAHSPPESVARCRDKLAMRRTLEQAGAPSARYALVSSLAEATPAAAALGYPVVVKPRALAGSLGVVKVDGPAGLAEAYATARSVHLPGYPQPDGVLVEEYLDGPEVSVDSVIFDGSVKVVTIARKQLAFDPYFEEVGHVVSGTEDPPDAGAVVEAVTAAQQALGMTFGVTHTELRLTAGGPRIVEVNPRLGGDMIPWLGYLALGADLAGAAADVAAGIRPRIDPERHGAAAVRFFYPRADMRFRQGAIDPALDHLPWLKRVAWEAQPGDVLRLPPAGFLSRLGFAVVEGVDGAECLRRLDAVESGLRIDHEPVASRPDRVAPASARNGRRRSRWEGTAACPPADATPPAHVFQTGEWLTAWERTTIEPASATAYLRPTDGSNLTPFYCVESSPFWRGYETEAGVDSVWRGPVVFSPSVYSIYGGGLADPPAIGAAIDRGLERVHDWGAEALVFVNIEGEEVRRWTEQRRPAAAFVLDLAFRAPVGATVDEHLAGLDGHVRREFRRQWRRARERGVTLLELHGPEMRPHLAEFQRLASATAERHSGDLYDLPTFEALSAVPAATLLVAERDGRWLGAFLCFAYREMLYLWAGGIDYANLAEFGTYAFLMYESLGYAIRTGCRILEVGRGNATFKERHGFRATELWTLVYLTENTGRNRELERRLGAMGDGLRKHLGLDR